MSKDEASVPSKKLEQLENQLHTPEGQAAYVDFLHDLNKKPLSRYLTSKYCSESQGFKCESEDRHLEIEPVDKSLLNVDCQKSIDEMVDSTATMLADRKLDADKTLNIVKEVQDLYREGGLQAVICFVHDLNNKIGSGGLRLDIHENKRSMETDKDEYENHVKPDWMGGMSVVDTRTGEEIGGGSVWLYSKSERAEQ